MEDMEIYRWILIVLIILSTFGTILLIDKPRRQTTKGSAIWTVIINSILIYVIFNL